MPIANPEIASINTRVKTLEDELRAVKTENSEHRLKNFRLLEVLQKTNDDLSIVKETLEKTVDDKTRLLVDRTTSLTTALIKTKDELKNSLEATAEMTTFITNISHDIKNQMTTISGMLCTLDETPQLTPIQKNLISNIKTAADSLISIVKDVLDVAKINSGKMLLHYEDFDMRMFLAKCLSPHKIEAKIKKIEFNVGIETDLHAKLIGDRNRIQQVLLNLTGNAIKFTQTGTITVTASLEKKIKCDNGAIRSYVKFTVCDTGIGISKENKNKLFKAFAQINNPVTTIYGGCGLGLTICKKLVEMMDGEIGFNSAIEKGSQFWFIIPLYEYFDGFDMSLLQK
jgi:signal transduction histidine kinase